MDYKFRKITVLALLIICKYAVNVFSQGIDSGFNGVYYPNPDITYSFQDGNLEIEEFIKKGQIIRNNYEYRYLEIDNISFLEINKENKWQRFLAVYSNEFLLLYEKPKSQPILGGFFGRYIYDIFLDNVEYSSTSFLDDEKYDYSAQNLGNMSLFTPWVEGVEGNGSGEKIHINYSNNIKITGFYISNGFVSYDKPFLYKQNSRLKKIKVYNADNSFRRNYELVDTPNIQFFDVPETRDLIIEIVDVYPGSKWEDTCINFILPESFLDK